MQYLILLLLILFGTQKETFSQQFVIDSLQNVLLTTNEDTAKANILSTIGFQYYRIGDYKSATKYADSALQLAERIDFKKGKAGACNILGIVLKSQGNISQALDNFISSQKIYKDIGNKKGMASTYNNIADAYLSQHNYQEALTNSLACLEISKENGDKIGIATSYNIIGDINVFQGNYPEAMNNYSAGLEICHEIDYKPGLASAYSDLGRIHANQGNFSEGLKFHSAALKINQEIENKNGIVAAYINIGSVYSRQGNFSEALNSFILALKINIEMGRKNGIADAYSNIGVVYSKMSNYNEALKNFFAAMEIRQEIGDKRGIANVYYNVGGVYQKQEKYAEALECFNNSLKISEEIGRKKGIASSLDKLGDLNKVQGNYAEAYKFYLASLEINSEIGSKDAIAENFVSLGSVNINLANYTKARKYLDDGLSLSKEIGAKELLKSSYLYFSELETAEHNYAKALENYKMYTIYKDSIFNEESSNQMNRLKIEYETEKKDREIELLNKDIEIKSLNLEQHEASMQFAAMEKQLDADKLRLLIAEKELQNLQLSNTMEELGHQYLHGKVQENEIALMQKDQEIKDEQLARQKVQRNGIFIIMVFLSLLGFLLFRGQHMRKKLEKQAAIIQERKRISADLHDDVGSGLSRIILLCEMVKKIAKTPETRNEAEKIGTISQELSLNISEIIWTLNANNDYLENLVAYIRRYAAEYFENSPVALKIITPSNIPHIPIGGEKRRNLFYAVKEALHNIIKHAEATEAKVKFAYNHNDLIITIHDNGKGIPHGELNRFGNGLNNMRSRMTSIKGNFIIENHVGTKITLSLPV